MTRTSKRLAARAAARQRQAKANEDHRRREQTELDHATDFEVARMRRDDAAATVVKHEIEMGRQVTTLLALGNPVARIVELTGETETEIRRLRKLTDGEASQTTGPISGVITGGERRRQPRSAASPDAAQSASTSSTAGSLPVTSPDTRDQGKRPAVPDADQ